MMSKTAFFFSLLLTAQTFAFVTPHSVNLEELPRADRWMARTQAEKEKRSKLAKNPLTKMGLAEALGNWETCVLEARKVPLQSVVRDWAWITELDCAQRWIDDEEKSKAKNTGPIVNSSVVSIEKNHLDWHNKPLGSKIQVALVSTKLALCRWYDKQSQWKELRVELQKLFKQEFMLSKIDRAQLYYFAGQLLVAERQWTGAYWQFERSKQLNPDSAVEGKIKGVMPMLSGALRSQIEAKLLKAQAENSSPQLVPSGEELEFFNQAQGYLARNDLQNAVEAMAELIKKFPMGVKAKWAQDKILELLMAEIEKSRGPQGISVAKKRIEKEMLYFDSDRQFEWGKVLFNIQAYAEAAPILKRSAEQMAGSAKAATPYYLAARAYQLSNSYADAKKIYQHLITAFPTAAEVIDAAIQWGLININENDPSEAITHLELARSRKMSNQQDLISLFWLFQSYKMKGTEAGILSTAQELTQRFHLTYYGLIAHYELQKRLPEYGKQKAKTAKVNFSENETSALERARALLAAGLLDAAGEELSIFSTRQLSSDESQYLSNYYAQALKHVKNFGLLTAVVEEDPERRNDFVVRQLFPKEFWDLVSDDKRRSQVDPFLLLSVMKQESAFDPNAVSRSNALGLLQMIPPTAEEVKKELNSDVKVPDDLHDPGTNVLFCAYYLSTLLKKFNGSVPLALAAYNAGPTRITQFMNAQGQLRDTWVDELPISETSFYVKSILKNYLMYRILYGGLTQLPTPPWVNGQTTVAK